MAVATTTIHNLGPLTTVWTAPDSCNLNYFIAKQAVGCQGQVCKAHDGVYGPVDDMRCWPPISGPLSTYSQTPIGSLGYYSPGIICPASLTKACEQVGGGGYQNFFFDYPPGESETAYGCCPTGFICSIDGDHQSCVSLATTDIQTVKCMNASLSTGSMPVPGTTYAFKDSNPASTMAYSEVSINARMIQIVFKSSDLPKETGVSAPGETKTSSGKTSGETLSGGAVAGIVIGVLACLALLGFGAFCFFKARSRKQKPLRPDEVELEEQDIKRGDFIDKSPSYSQQALHPDMHWRGHQELPTGTTHHELQ